MTKTKIWPVAVMLLFASLPVRAIEGLSERIDIAFSYEEGFDAIGTAAYESASTAHNIQLSTLSDCYFMYVPHSPDGRVTEEYPHANFAFCAATGEDVIGRIDFIQPIKSLTINIPYFANGVVTFQAFSQAGAKLYEMQAQNQVGFGETDVGGEPVAYVILSGNHMDAAINIDDILIQTMGVERAVLQTVNAPLLIDATDFETINNPSNPDTVYWRQHADRGARGLTLFAEQGASSPDDSGSQDSVAQYPVVLSSAGQYYLYVLGRRLAETVDVSKPRIWLSSTLDEEMPSGELEITLNNTYRWHRFGPITVGASDLGKVRSLYLGVRTAGVSIDEMVLAANGSLSESQLAGMVEQTGKPAWEADYDSLEFDWTQLRGNRRQTGRSRIVGVLDSAPTIKSSLNYEHNNALIAIDLDNPSETTLLPFMSFENNVTDAELAKNWRYGNPIFQLNANGDESYYRPDRQNKYGHWLPGESNLQRIAIRQGNRVEFSKWNSGSWLSLWHWQEGALKDVGQPMVGDFDNDGRIEAAFLPWEDLWMVDLETGNLEQKARFIPNESDNGRPYGWSGGINLFEDSRAEFLIIGDFHNHIEVLGWNAENKLEKRWDWMIENGISAKETIIHTGVNPTGDIIAGNEMREIAVSVFNATSDGKWHTLVMSSLDGSVLHDFSDRYLSRLYDINGDGYEELLLTPTTGRLVRENAGGSIIALTGNTPQTLFSFDAGGFAEYEIQMSADNINTQTGKGRETVFIAEFNSANPVFASWNEARNIITFWRFTDHVTTIALGSVDKGIYDYQLGLAGFDFAGTSDHEVLVWARSFDSPSALQTDFQAEVFFNREGSSSAQPGAVIGKLAEEGPPAIIVDAGLNLVRKAAMDNGDLLENWSVQGRSTAQGILGVGQSILLADVSGDQYYELLVAGRDESGAATMTATSSGLPVWTTVMSGFQGWLPNWNEGGLITWNAGKFRGGPKDDVVVSLRRSSMHSDETHLLDGGTGNDLWTRKSLWQGKIESNGRGRGAGGSFDAVIDINLDNKDELAISFPDGVAMLGGEDGSSVIEKWSVEMFGEQVFFKQSLPFDGEDNIPYLATFDSSNGVNLFDENLDAVWTVGSGGAGASIAVLADVDGNGVQEMVVVGDDGQSSIVAYNPDGSRHWTYNTRINQVMAVSADIDNDGRDEILYARDHQLVAMEDLNGVPTEKWVWNSPNGTRQESPSLGDVDEDGDLEIVLFDGKDLFVLGNETQPPAPGTPEFRLASEQFEAGSLRISWEHAAFATDYRLLIASDAAMNNIINEMAFSRKQSDLVRHFGQGEYWIRLEASNPQGTSMSAIRHLVVGESLNKLPGIFADGFE